MKTLQACLIANSQTDINPFREIAGGLSDLQVTIETDLERVVDALNARTFDLLIIDLELPKEDYKKINRLTTQVFADIATVEIDLSQPHYIAYKMNMMLSKWKDAQSDSSTIFIDNPDLR